VFYVPRLSDNNTDASCLLQINMFIGSVFALIVAAGAAAKPVLSPRNTAIYATFYNDDACTEGAGQPVSTTNPGCLNESGRQSVYFQTATTDKSYYLIYSPSTDCPCQSYAQFIVGEVQLPACVKLDGPAAQSYRFVEDTGPAAANNC
jgi:hypothetical protein